MVKRKVETDTQVITLKDNFFHLYFSYISIAKDSVSPIGICKMEMPYEQESLDYWMKYDDIVVISFLTKETNDENYLKKLKTKNKIKNDEYNYSFIGRINKVKQKGNKVIILLDDIGWKFQQKVPKDFRDKYIAGQSLDDAFQAICEFIDVRFCYNIEELNKYTFADDGYSIQKDGETIEEIEDIFDLITEKEQKDSLDNPYHENEGLFDYDTGHMSSSDSSVQQTGKALVGALNEINKLVNQATQTATDVQNTQNSDKENKKNLEEKKKKYEKDFKQKIQDLFVGNKYYDSNLTSSILNYGSITIQPKINDTTSPTNISQINPDGTTESGTGGGTSSASIQSFNTQATKMFNDLKNLPIFHSRSKKYTTTNIDFNKIRQLQRWIRG